MTWNVENLFRPRTEGGPTSEAVYEAKLKGLAAMINAQALDALSLQEVGSPAALDDLVDLLDGDCHRRVPRISITGRSGRVADTTRDHRL
jgi:hypothetical protein